MTRAFISWSGDRSKSLALAMHDWLPLVLHYVEPWLSQSDIGAGERWARQVAEQLANTNFGIVCITPENKDSPWILFESGALAKSLELGKVIPVLMDLEFSDVSGPLAQFQAKKLNRDGIAEIINSLQSSAETPIPEQRQHQLFTALWPELEKRISTIVNAEPRQRELRPQTEVLEELVTSVRSIDSRMRQSEEPYVENQVSRRDLRRLRPSPSMLRELVASVSEESSDPVGLLIYSSFFREELPWIAELSTEAYRAMVGARIDATKAIQSLTVALNDRNRFSLDELTSDPVAMDVLRREFHHYLQRFNPEL